MVFKNDLSKNQVLFHISMIRKDIVFTMQKLFLIGVGEKKKCALDVSSGASCCIVGMNGLSVRM